MLSVCCINFSTVAGEAGGTEEEEGPTAELPPLRGTVLIPNAAVVALVLLPRRC